MTQETQKASDTWFHSEQSIYNLNNNKKNLKTQQWPNRNRFILDLSGNCAKIIMSYTCA